jgi:hypothetical protein
MAQLWLTFEEIQEMFGCDAAGARRRVIANEWERRRGHDGLTRALLPPEVANDYMLGHRSKQEAPCASASNFEAAMTALRRVFAEDATNASRDAAAAGAEAGNGSAESRGDAGFPTWTWVSAPETDGRPIYSVLMRSNARHHRWPQAWRRGAAVVALARDAVA